MVSSSPRLVSLRRLLTKHGLAAYLVPSEDAHASEYIAERDERRAFISGFTGSRGTALVTASKALLWTDGRYFLQANEQLDSNWTLMKEGVEGVPSVEGWLEQNLKAEEKVGVDPWLVPAAEKKDMEKRGINMELIEENLIDQLWDDQCPHPENPVLPLGLSSTGESWPSKLVRFRASMTESKVDVLILSDLDDVAYAFNLRGSDIKFNPVFFSYAVITTNTATLFLSEKQVTDTVRSHLQASDKEGGEKIAIKDYNDIRSFLERLPADQSTVWVSPGASLGLCLSLKGKKIYTETTPVCTAKAIKNETELEGFRRCHVRDGAALCVYLAWLEKTLKKGETVSEVAGADRLAAFRSEMKDFVGLSFATISGAGPNGAIIHYKPKVETCRNITLDEMYLVDSGAQYKDGTTDVTRTVHFGTPTEHEKECFTRVLKGQIKLARCVFPQGTSGHRLDSFARACLWQAGLDYAHGTGHGVGSYLNVHEGPMGIGKRPRASDPGLEAGMVLSNEPGYYEDGKFGVRIENLVKVVKADTKHRFDDKDYLTFEDLTLAPIQRKLIVPSMLDAEEVSYLNDYHVRCREELCGLLREVGTSQEQKEGINWILRETEPLG